MITRTELERAAGQLSSNVATGSEPGNPLREPERPTSVAALAERERSLGSFLGQHVHAARQLSETPAVAAQDVPPEQSTCHQRRQLGCETRHATQDVPTTGFLGDLSSLECPCEGASDVSLGSLKGDGERRRVGGLDQSERAQNRFEIILGHSFRVTLKRKLFDRPQRLSRDHDGSINDLDQATSHPASQDSPSLGTLTSGGMQQRLGTVGLQVEEALGPPEPVVSLVHGQRRLTRERPGREFLHGAERA